MKGLQIKYNFVHILFWISTCAIYGYVAVFLQYKGLSNTLIGIVTGGACLFSIIASPTISSFITKIKGLTIKKLITIIYIFMSLSFILVTFLNLPTFFIMGLYIVLIVLILSVVPFLSTICMNYLKKGYYVDFGVARGLGSAAYAISAVVLGQLIDFFNPTILVCVFLISSIFLLILLYFMPNSDIQNHEEKSRENNSLLTIFKKYKVFIFILFAIAFQVGASTSLGTYLINIVTDLGGTTSLYGIAVFCMGISEMPVMAFTHTLLKKFKSETLLLAASFFYLFRNMIISFAPSIPVLFIGALFQGISYGLFLATITYYVNDYLAENDQLMGQTLITVMTSGLGSFVGNIFGGILQDSFGLYSMKIFVCILTVIGFMIMFMTLRGKTGKNIVNNIE